MSALHLRKVTAVEISSDSCAEEDCSRKGRYAVSIAGHPLRPTSRLALSRQAVLCPKHGRAWERLWADLNGSEELREVEAAIKGLSGSPATRSDAIDTLRRLGLSAEEAALTRARVSEGQSVEEILEGLVGATELEAVA